MKRLVVLFLVFTIVSQSLVNVGIALYYHLNKVYITQQLCENRNNPKMHCNGKCYLSKQLNKAEEAERKSSAVLKDKTEMISLLPFCNSVYSFFPIKEKEIALIFTSRLLIVDHGLDLTQPPEA